MGTERSLVRILPIVIFLEQEIYLMLLHSIQVYKRVPVREIRQCVAAASGAKCEQPTYDPVIRGLNGMSSEHALHGY